METFNIKVKNIGIIPISAISGEEAVDILQSYIDKRSLNGTIEYE